MYSDTDKKRRTGSAVFLILVIAVLVLLGLSELAFRSRDMENEAAAAIKAAVEREALQCYIVEGVYPPNLSYLEEKYGLQINHSDYYVTYSAFASNIPPTVIVTAR